MSILRGIGNAVRRPRIDLLIFRINQPPTTTDSLHQNVLGGCTSLFLDTSERSRNESLLISLCRKYRPNLVFPKRSSPFVRRSSCRPSDQPRASKNSSGAHFIRVLESLHADFHGQLGDFVTELSQWCDEFRHRFISAIFFYKRLYLRAEFTQFCAVVLLARSCDPTSPKIELCWYLRRSS